MTEREYQLWKSKRDADAVLDVLSSESGRNALRQILALTYPDERCYATDPHATAFRCGVHSVGLAITRLLKNTDLKCFRKMEAESDADIEQLLDIRKMKGTLDG